MDVQQLAEQAVALIVGYCERVASGVAEDVSDSAAARLHDLVKNRLALNARGRSVVARVEGHPGDEMGARDLAAALATALQDDPELAAAVGALVPPNAQTATLGSSGPVQASISVGKMRGSQLSLGPMTINNSRQVRVAVGGVGIVVALAVLALIANPWSSPATPTNADTPSASGGTTTTLQVTTSRGVATTSVAVSPVIGIDDVVASFQSVGAEPTVSNGDAQLICDTGAVMPGWEGLVSASNDGLASATVYETATQAAQYVDSLHAVLAEVQVSGDPIRCVDVDGAGMSYESPSAVSVSGAGTVTFTATATRLGPGGAIVEQFDWGADVVACGNLVVDGPAGDVPGTVRLLACG